MSLHRGRTRPSVQQLEGAKPTDGMPLDSLDKRAHISNPMGVRPRAKTGQSIVLPKSSRDFQ